MPRDRKKIMVVEDDASWLDKLTEVIEGQDEYSVVATNSVAGAFQAIKANPEIQLVVTDLILDATDADAGIRLVESIRQQRPHVPIIVISGYLSDFQTELLRLGVDSVISKGDFDVGTFYAILDKAVSRQGQVIAKQAQQPVLLSDIERILVAQIEKYSPIKERTIDVPLQGRYELIKPLIGFKRDIERQIARLPFSKNVFLMMKFRDSNRELGEFISESLGVHGLRGIRADSDDWNITKNVYNPIAVLYCCKYGIALFDEPEEYQAYSPNVAYELGMMHYQNKECLILRHASLPSVPFDLIKDLYVTYNRDLQVRRTVERWVKQIAK